jgi:transcriptional regulator with XRE-family HTH domain
MTLKEKLREQRISVMWLAERIGVSRPTLYKYLNKPDEFKVKHVRRIAKYLDLTERDALINFFKQAESYE